jgi:hypothetical protein
MTHYFGYRIIRFPNYREGAIEVKPDSSTAEKSSPDMTQWRDRLGTETLTLSPKGRAGNDPAFFLGFRRPASCYTSSLKENPMNLTWEASFEAALEKARAQDRLVMVEFHSPH